VTPAGLLAAARRRRPPIASAPPGATSPTLPGRASSSSERGTIPRSCGPGWRPAFCGPSHWPETGRFIQQDPEGDGIKWYVYVANNPLVWADPEGLYRDSIHRRDTARGARCAGLGGEAAKLMGFAAWWIDQQGWRSKMGPPHYGDQLGYAARQFRKAKLLYRRGRRRQAYVQLGFGAHAVQDFYSHYMPPEAHWLLDKGGWSPDDPANDPCLYNMGLGHLNSYLGQFHAGISGRPYKGSPFAHKHPRFWPTERPVALPLGPAF